MLQAGTHNIHWPRAHASPTPYPGQSHPTVCYIQFDKDQDGFCHFKLKVLTAFQLILASLFIGSDLCLPELSDSVSFLY